MSATCVRIGPGAPFTLPETRGDPARIDAEAETGALEREDETGAMLDMTRYAPGYHPDRAGATCRHAVR